MAFFETFKARVSRKRTARVRLPFQRAGIQPDKLVRRAYPEQAGKQRNNAYPAPHPDRTGQCGAYERQTDHDTNDPINSTYVTHGNPLRFVAAGAADMKR
jgi:hypothetical protein